MMSNAELLDAQRRRDDALDAQRARERDALTPARRRALAHASDVALNDLLDADARCIVAHMTLVDASRATLDDACDAYAHACIERDANTRRVFSAYDTLDAATLNALRTHAFKHAYARVLRTLLSAWSTFHARRPALRAARRYVQE
jgi:hypothetical protein